MSNPEASSQLSTGDKRERLRRLLQERAAARWELPLSHGQQALWFLHELDPDSVAYNVVFAVRVRSPLDLRALRNALQALVDRHAALRTTFSERDGQPVQIVHASRQFVLTEIDARGWSEADLYHRVSAEAYLPFELASGPLFRGTVFTRGHDDHVLLFAVHHIIGDFWSMLLMMSDVARTYRPGATPSATPLPPPSTRFADYVRWHNALMASPEGERLWHYWRSQLSGELPFLDLPTDRPYPLTQSEAGTAINFPFEDRLSRDLLALARRENTTPFMVLLAAYDVLLHRYSRQTDILVGSPAACRGKRGFEQIVGYLTNMIVLRADLSGNTTFRQLLQNVRRTVLDGMNHQDYPFSRLVERLQPIRDPRRPPLFQAAFLMEKSHLRDIQSAASLIIGKKGSSLDLNGLVMEPFGLKAQATPFEIGLIVEEADQHFSGCIQYNSDLFDAPTIERLIDSYQQILAAVAGDPDQPVNELPMLSRAERQKLLVRWNATSLPFAEGMCVHELIAQRAREIPDALAVVSDDRRLTYGDLDARANRLARHLRALGVGPEVLVGVCVRRDAEMVVGLLAILKAGGAYVPLDPGFPPSRLQYMLEDADAPVLVSQQDLLTLFPSYAGHVVCLDADRSAIDRAPGDPLPSEATPDNLAYVIYTSGSTGRPKGVQVAHRAVVNFLASMMREPGLDATDVLLSVTTLSFDILGLEIYLPLLAGASVVLAPQDAVADPVALARLLSQTGATVMQATPATWQMLLHAKWPGAANLRILAGGEALNTELAKGLLQRGKQLWNLYGPTETTIWSTASHVEPDFARISIGSPIGNTQVYVLDEHLQPVPVGVPGELHIGGTGVARGYRNRPDLTAERFLPDPFGDRPGGRLYKTGDLTRWLPNGRLEFLGRLDHQVKVRGFRIELGEIESALARHASVRESVVRVFPDSAGQNQLVAYVVPSNGETPTAASLREVLRRSLPDYMVPSAFVALDQLPLTPNGKVDRKALPAPQGARPDLERQYAAPRNQREQLLADIWANVLRVDRVGVEDGLFDLGGHSLLATQILSRVRQQFHVDVPLRELFEKPTVAKLAELIDHAEQQHRLTVPIPRADRTIPLPLSFAQERLWFLDQLEPNSPLYNVPAAVRLSGHLDAAALKSCLNQIVRRHETLRTRFVTVDGRAVQQIVETVTVELPLLDLSALPQVDRDSHVSRLATEEARQPFSLASTPLIRARLLRLATDEHVLLLTMHHIVSDGWSLGILAAELAALYDAATTGQAAPLPELAVQYADYAAWQRQEMTGTRLREQLQFWQQQLLGTPPALELPTDRKRPVVQSYAGTHIRVNVPADLTESLRQLGHRHDATLFMTLLAAFQTLLARYSGQNQVCIGTPVAGRQHPDFEKLIGVFINTLVLRADFTQSDTFERLLDQIRDRTLSAYQNQDIPFEFLVDQLRPERDLSRTPLFQVMFVFQNVPQPNIALKGLSVTPLAFETGTSKFDLMLQLEQTPSGLQGWMEYNTDLFDAITIERLIANFDTLLKSVVHSPSQELKSLPLLSASERGAVVESFNATDVAYGLSGVCLHELFERQAARTPEAAAVVFEERSWSYAELNARANHLARHLRDLGVGRDTVVGVCLDRSLEMVLALYAILKAGGAYLPLEPDQPSERLASILSDSRVELVIAGRREAELLRDWPGRVLPLEAEPEPVWRAYAREPVGNLPRVSGAADLAYVIYTSGSTGRPKGVMVAHAGIVNRLAWMQAAYGLEPGERVLQKTPFGFDVSVWEFFWPLTCGATLVVARPGGHQDSAYLVETLARSAITTVHFVPSMLGVLVEEPGLESLGTTLRRVICSGEALPYALQERLLARLPDVALYNLYGPTEASVDVTAWTCRRGDPRAMVPIGGPIGNMRCYVLDGDLGVVPVGVPGELHLGGVGLARGYRGRAELTASSFVPDPYGGERGGRLYRTGDVCRWLADGTLEYLGRRDHQVKIRGNRIELGEIEAVLAGTPFLRESVVACRRDGGVARLVAYVVPRDGERVTVEQVQSAVRGRLPESMVPSSVVLLERLPQLPNGKVDRRALPAPESDRGELASEYVAPRTAVESQLAAIWSQVLGVSRVGVRDNYFALGGDSIRSIQIVARARAAGLELTLPQLFQAPRIEELALVAGQGGAAESPVARTAAWELVSAADRAALSSQRPELEDAYPLVELQAGMLFHSALGAAVGTYHDVFSCRIGVRLDEEALRASLLEVMGRHAVLRTRFDLTRYSQPLQLVEREVAVPLSVEDLTRLSADEQTARVRAWLEDEKGRTFDWTTAPLWRLQVHRLATDRFQLSLSFHHAIADGWSVATLLAELFGSYGRR
ncbi:MAG: amino acid adenylation domain-containing protein, partial [Planctomycetes bacterium]|nr:amino acid adenylation domain-containing protein [Planctomycetota bacterium]